MEERADDEGDSFRVLGESDTLKDLREKIDQIS